MAINFPINPSIGDTHTVGGSLWRWNGYAWARIPDPGAKGQKGQEASKGQKGEQNDKGQKGSKGEPSTVKGQKGQHGDKGQKGADNSTKGQKGEQNDKGQKGQAGVFGGVTFDYTYLTDNVDSDPGAGNLKFNGTALHTTSPLIMYIDDVDDGSRDIQTYLRTIDDSTSTIKGHFRISNKLDSTDYAIFSINGTSTEASGYFKIPCTHLDGATSFSNNEDVVITFARTGDIGQKGQKGEEGQKGQKGEQNDKGQKGEKGFGDKGQKGEEGSTSINNNADNKVITGSDTANELNAEADLTYDGTKLKLIDDKRIHFGTNNDLKISHTNDLSGQNDSEGNDILAGGDWASYIQEAGTGPLIFKSDGGPSTGAFQFYDTSWRPILKLFSGTGARAALYYAGSEKLITDTSGISITGGIKDKDGQLGSAGQVLSSTGTALDWVDNTAGDKGQKGESVKGQKGEVGSTTKGDKGAPGADNSTKGQKGAPGADNSTKGQKGSQGPQGNPGNDGNDGNQGNKGAQGPQGNPGNNGNNGNNGNKGQKGAQGPQGNPGNNGNDGNNGNKGAQGPQGNPGNNGNNGNKGAQGPQGNPGNNGNNGNKGAQGPQGNKGAQGNPGSDASLPSGIVVIWSGSSSNIPSGWSLYTTLAGKFVLGAGGSYSGSGGYADAAVISHTHGGGTYSAGSNGAHQHTSRVSPPYYDNENDGDTDWAIGTSPGGNRNIGNNTGAHTHSMSGTSGSASGGVSGTGRNMPPYYVLCWIKKN